MEHSRKMVLVPPHMLQSLQAASSVSTNHHLNELDEKMRLVLERNDLNIHDKANLYSQYLQNFLKSSNNSKKPFSVEVREVSSGGDSADPEQLQSSKGSEPENIEPDPIEHEIMNHIPKSYVNRASHLLQKLKTNPAIGWTSTGQLVMHGRTIRGSNVCDLMYDIFRERRGYSPTGSDQFMRILGEMNIPDTYVTNPKRRQDLQRWKRMEMAEEGASREDRDEKVAPRVRGAGKSKSALGSSGVNHPTSKWANF